MNSQPNEIITYILSYLDNHTLMFARNTCHQWKHLIETRIFYKSTIPELHICILTGDFYHFGKYYLNYSYDTKYSSIGTPKINDAVYYNELVKIITKKSTICKFFHNIIPRNNLSISVSFLLIYASYRGHLEVVKYLISIKANSHTVYNDALRQSAKKGHLEIVKYLISIGANHNDALIWSANGGHLEMVKYLIGIGADIHTHNDTALRWGAQFGYLEVVKYLISMGANLHADNDYALRYGTPKIIEFFKSISEKN